MQKASQKLQNKIMNDIWKTELSNATYGLNKSLTNKKRKNDFLKKR